MKILDEENVALRIGPIQGECQNVVYINENKSRTENIYPGTHSSWLPRGTLFGEPHPDVVKISEPN